MKSKAASFNLGGNLKRTKISKHYWKFIKNHFSLKAEYSLGPLNKVAILRTGNNANIAPTLSHDASLNDNRDHITIQAVNVITVLAETNRLLAGKHQIGINENGTDTNSPSNKNNSHCTTHASSQSGTFNLFFRDHRLEMTLPSQPNGHYG